MFLYTLICFSYNYILILKYNYFKVIGQPVLQTPANIQQNLTAHSSTNSITTTSSTSNNLPDFSKNVAVNKPSQIVRPQMVPVPPQYVPSTESSVDLTDTFEWMNYLQDDEFNAAPVNCFRHVSFKLFILILILILIYSVLYCIFFIIK